MHILLLSFVVSSTPCLAQTPPPDAAEIAIRRAEIMAQRKAEEERKDAERRALLAEHAKVYPLIEPAFRLIADKDFDGFATNYCSTRHLCTNDEAIAALKKGALKDARALKCIVGKEEVFAPSRIDGDPRTDSKLKLYVQCTPASRAPQPFGLVRVDDAWLISSFPR